jgi:hypothetical protein
MQFTTRLIVGLGLLINTAIAEPIAASGPIVALPAKQVEERYYGEFCGYDGKLCTFHPINTSH